jgi:class 3 adenylate cyclase/tetratricopeptide (TPR) repeat protein
MAVCANCGTDNPDVARFCLACGRPLEPTTAGDVRKVVTVLFSDVTGSTSLGERLDPESLRQVMGRYFDEMKQALEAHGGTVEKFIGDAVMAVFGIPTLHEDDALRAVRAAIEMRQRLARLNEDLERDRGITIVTRTGLNTGEVVAGDPSTGQTLVTGDPVNVAARLEQAAQPGEILIGEDTHRLLREAVVAEPVEPLALKGKEQRVAAYRLQEVLPGAEAVRRHLDSPMIGRDRQLALMKQAFEASVEDRACQLFTVIGSPGVGKSRLVQEFVASVAGRSTVLRGRCLPYGEGITYWPVAQMVQEAAAITSQDSALAAEAKLATLIVEQERDAVSERLLQAIGLREAAAPAEEIAWAFRKLMESLARDRPVVPVFDDIHWAEPTLLDLIDHVTDWSRESSIMLVSIARQELLDVRSGWAGGKHNATTIQLEPLTAQDCELLVESLLGMTLLPTDAKSRIAEAAEGNPLFVEQVLSMLIDDDLLRRDDGHWIPTADLATIPIPPTIQALLAARLDRLGKPERQVIERASVVGKVFYLGAVSHLAPEPLRPEVGTHLMSLVRKELIRPDASDVVGETAFRFRHILIRDAAYHGMPKETRAELHEAFAGWLEEMAGDRVAEFEEIIGYHLEQAYRYREELGRIDDRARGVAARAAEYLGAASQRAVNRSDMSAAGGLLRRTIGLLPPEDPSRLDRLLDLAWADQELGEFAEAPAAVDEVTSAARAAGDRRMELRAELVGAMRWDLTKSWEERMARAQEAIPLLEESGDDLGLYYAHRAIASTHWTHGRAGDSVDELQKVIEYAGRAGTPHGAFILHWLAGALLWGPTPAEDGVVRCDALLAEATGSRFAQGSILTVQACLSAMAGRVDQARAVEARSQALIGDLGGVVSTMAIGSRLGLMHEVLGEYEEAAAVMVPACETLFRLGEKSFFSTLAPQMARVMALMGRLEEAEDFAVRGRDAAPADDWASQICWREALALVAAFRGDLPEAERRAREAVGMTEDVDYLPQMADAWSDLGTVLGLAGRKDEAADAWRRALSLFEAKGDVVRAARTRDELARLAE